MTMAFGICVGPSDRFERLTLPSLQRFAPGSPVLVRRSSPSLFAGYTSLIAEARALDLDALVLLHDDVELLEDIRPALAEVFTEHSADVIGAVGGRNAPDMTWWEGDRVGGVVHPEVEEDWGRGTHQCDLVDGLLMALSPKALSTITLRRGLYPRWHGYDAELCTVVRRTGGQVWVAPIAVAHHSSMHLDVENYWIAKLAWKARWSPSRRARAVSRALALGHRGSRRAARAAPLGPTRLAEVEGPDPPRPLTPSRVRARWRP